MKYIMRRTIHIVNTEAKIVQQNKLKTLLPQYPAWENIHFVHIDCTFMQGDAPFKKYTQIILKARHLPINRLQHGALISGLPVKNYMVA